MTAGGVRNACPLRDTHLDQIVAKLREPRVLCVIEGLREYSPVHGERIAVC